jgi:hypothetical protein
VPIKKTRKPVGEPTRRSTRVPKTTVSTAQASANPEQGEKHHRKTRVPTTLVSSKEPTRRQLNLLHKVFADDEDRSKEFYVTDVKYVVSYQTVCCFCVPYHGDVVTAEFSAADLHKSSNADDYIYDCDYVRNNIVGNISDDDKT